MMNRWGTEVVMVMSKKKEILWVRKEVAVYRRLKKKMFIEFKDNSVYPLLVSVSKIRLTLNKMCIFRGMWVDYNESFLAKLLGMVLSMRGVEMEESLTFYYVERNPRSVAVCKM
jgi:hypothetical protein